MRLPSPDSLRAELREGLPPGNCESSVVQFGCEGCPGGHRFVAGWLSVAKLFEMTDAEVGIPRAFVTDRFSLIGKAKACPVNETTGEPDCQHEDTVKTVISRSQPFPEI
jgi:hypothetical protein